MFGLIEERQMAVLCVGSKTDRGLDILSGLEKEAAFVDNGVAGESGIEIIAVVKHDLQPDGRLCHAISEVFVFVESEGVMQHGDPVDFHAAYDDLSIGALCAEDIMILKEGYVSFA